MKLISLFLILTITYAAKSSKILVAYPMASYSHFSMGFRIAKELADRGHEVSFINSYPQKTPIKNLKDISVEEHVVWMDELKKVLLDMNSDAGNNKMTHILEMGNKLTNETLGHKNVQKLIKSGETFDVVIIEHFLSDALVALGHIFKAPVIFVAPMASSAMNNYLYANPAPSSYVPNTLGSFTKHMNFWQRLSNLFFNIFGDVMREKILLSQQRKVFKEYVKDPNIELDDLLYNTSLMLTNSHYSVNDAVPHVPSIIEIGGFHIKPTKKLPDDIKKFLDDAKEGVVLFSMGSNLKSKDMKPETRDAILKAFSKINQKVLWKFETELPDAPKNVKILNWIPQQDVLAHPNVKAFISHGGLLSTLEAVHFGVPIIGIPVFGDQMSNIASAVANGYAIKLPLTELTEEKLSKALDEILNNPKYRDNIKWRSSIMRDRPLSPIDTAVYWIEHVIRHRGAPHLRSAGLDLPWYQRDMLDITVFLTVIVLLVIVVFCKITKRIMRCFCKKTKAASKSKKNN